MDIITLRRRMGVSRYRLSKLLGLSHQAVAMWEAGRTRPAIESAHRLIDLAAQHQIQLSLDDIYPRGGSRCDQTAGRVC